MFLFISPNNWWLSALSIGFMLFSGGVRLGDLNIMAVACVLLGAFIFIKGKDGLRDVGDSITETFQRVRREGIAGILNQFRWEGHPFNQNFDARGIWRRPEERTETPPRNLTAEQVQRRVDALPTEVYATDEELLARSVKELKKRLSNRLIPRRKVQACLDRKDLVELMHTVSGSSASTCVICLEDYESGDSIRILPACQHVYHVDCFNQWAQADLAKSLKCPTCKHDMF